MEEEGEKGVGETGERQRRKYTLSLEMEREKGEPAADTRGTCRCLRRSSRWLWGALVALPARLAIVPPSRLLPACLTGTFAGIALDSNAPEPSSQHALFPPQDHACI